MVASALSVSDDQRVELTKMAASSSLPHRQVVQARALLWAGEGVATEEIARRSGVDSDTVRRWRSRFVERGTAGVGVIAKTRTWAGAGHGRRSAG
jgi:transposase-like protein